MDRLFASGDLDEKRCKELKALRGRLDPFKLSEVVNHKLERIWELAHYRYKPAEEEKKAKDELSSVERETLEAISQAFGITVYIRSCRGGDLVAVNHG